MFDLPRKRFWTDAIKDVLDEHPIIIVGGLILGSFMAGIGAYQTVLSMAGQQVIPAAEVLRLNSEITRLDKLQGEKSAEVEKTKTELANLNQGIDNLVASKSFRMSQVEITKKWREAANVSSALRYQEQHRHRQAEDDPLIQALYVLLKLDIPELNEKVEMSISETFRLRQSGGVNPGLNETLRELRSKIEAQNASL